jgi:bifunctional non-homologous end joining protein LigD
MASKKKPQFSPAFVTPMAAVAVKRLPEGAEWFYEVKFDGYRALVIKDGAWVEIQSRNHKNLTAMYPTVRSAVSRLGANQVVIDGEIVALDERGRPAFQALQHRSSHLKHQIAFYGRAPVPWTVFSVFSDRIFVLPPRSYTAGQSRAAGGRSSVLAAMDVVR